MAHDLSTLDDSGDTVNHITSPTVVASDPTATHGISEQPLQAADDENGAPSDGPPSVSRVASMFNLTTPESQQSDTSRSTSRDVTWTSMFEHVLNSRRDQDRQTAIDKCAITYLGETFPLAAVMEQLKQEGRVQLHHPGPPVVDEFSGVSGEQQHPHHVPSEDLAFLRAKGAFTHPDSDMLTAFTSTFWSRVYPCYPIVNRREFAHQLKQGKLPWLLLHSFCFIGATFCPLATLHRAKFADRKEARMHFYQKAKYLFDFGYELNKVVALQSVILLAFWAGSPSEYRNFYSWNSTGITIAETMGLHRSMNQSMLKKEDVTLLRRLWWVLAIRDASCGALVGRPFRINMYFCDTEMLAEDDFQDDMAEPEFAQHPLQATFGLYQIHMSKLSLILRDIVQQKYDLKNGRLTTKNINHMLAQWHQDLPEQLRLSGLPFGAEPNVFAQCLAMAHDHHQILANLDDATFTLPTPQEEQNEMAMTQAQLVDAAANRILNTASALVRTNAQASMPHECFSALFLAETVFYSQMRSPQRHRAALGKSSVDTCQMVWHSFMDVWDSAPWVMKLFDNLIANAQQDIESGKAHGPNLTQPSDYSLQTFDMSDIDFGGIGDDWQTYPVLSTVFDLPMGQNQSGTMEPPFAFTPIDSSR